MASTLASRGVSEVRKRAGAALFDRIAGPEGPANRARIHETPGPRWFAADRPIRQVHGDAAMFVGGLRALLLQSLHPLAMAAVAEHSGYQSDPWGRLQRTSTFLAVTTFGPAGDAERAVAKVRGVHRRISGVAPDGRTYRASDPHLLGWVHVAEVDSFLRCHQRYGSVPLSAADCDGYLADAAQIARRLGVPDPPVDQAGLAAALAAYRPELGQTTAAREAAEFLLRHPPLPLAVRVPYAVLSASAVSMLPRWAHECLGLRYRSLTESTAVRMAGIGLVRAIRWAMTPPADLDRAA